MSVLTKEEEEFIDHLGRMDANYYICPERSHILKLIHIIDRLVAENEKFEFLWNEAEKDLTEADNEGERIQAKLSSLLEAVEQVLNHSAFINDQVRCADIEMLFDDLNSVVQKIKGEKR